MLWSPSPFGVSAFRQRAASCREGFPTALTEVLSLATSAAHNHGHHLVSLERSLCCFHRKEAQPWLDQPFDKAMVLLDQVVQVFDQGFSSTDAGRMPAALSSAMALG